MIVSTNKRSLEFRSVEVMRVMHALLNEKSCALLGTDGIGKTSFLRHLISEAVRRKFLGDLYRSFLFLLLDTRTCAVTLLSCLRQIALLFQQILPVHLYTTEEILQTEHETGVQHILFDYAAALDALRERYSIVICIDDFDIILRHFGAQFLGILQELRQRAHGSISYIVAASNGPALLSASREQLLVHERFDELFNSYVWGLRPLVESDALDLIEHHLPDISTAIATPTEFVIRRLLDVTGSHPGLLRATVIALADGSLVLHGQENLEQIVQKLLDDGMVRAQCRRLWRSLSKAEQVCLKEVRQDYLLRKRLLRHLPAPLVDAALQALTLKGVCSTEDHAVYRCFSPLLTAYITQLLSSRVRGLQLDPVNRQVYVDGELVQRHLSKKEFRLLELLASDPGRVFSREETTWEIYKEKYTPRQDDERLDALVERTRRDIGDSSREPRFLETVRGSGHRLNEYIGRRSSTECSDV